VRQSAVRTPFPKKKEPTNPQTKLETKATSDVNFFKKTRHEKIKHIEIIVNARRSVPQKKRMCRAALGQLKKNTKDRRKKANIFVREDLEY